MVAIYRVRPLFFAALFAFAAVLWGGGCRSELLSCSDGIRNGAETDIDCGGGCAPCENGRTCRAGSDCRSHLCAADHSCRDPNPCHDGIRDLDETDLDCGGSCPPCANGKMCNLPSDCRIGDCTLGRCALPISCENLRRDGRETDIDCGGGDCPACPTGAACAQNADCVSFVCINNACQASPCSDGIRDQNETDVDCGGPICPPCADGNGCRLPIDCLSHLCNQGVCQTSSMGCPIGYREDAKTGVCVCDPTTCGTCCNATENNLCGITTNPAANNCGSRGQSCFRCDFAKSQSCIHGQSGDYCALGCDQAACAGCCAKGQMLKMFCLHGDDDGACGSGGGTCASCPMGQRCVAHACVPVPDGGN